MSVSQASRLRNQNKEKYYNTYFNEVLNNDEILEKKRLTFTKMSVKSHVSLIDLSVQLPFYIDDKLKSEICFEETLIMSCGHYAGDIDRESSSSEWTCRETSSSEVTAEVKKTEPYEVKDFVEEESKVEEEEEYDEDFFFFFFPDCKKPPPVQHSKDSLVMVDGLPQINFAAKSHILCNCKKGKGGRCPCFTNMPCYCGAKTTFECTCRDLENICVCQPGPPKVVCKCKTAKVCLCDPDGKIIPECICHKVERPCVCPPFVAPYPICKCKHKPNFNLDKTDSSVSSIRYEGEYNYYDYKTVQEESEQEPCECQKVPEPKKCRCRKGDKCVCRIACICGLQRICQCESSDSLDVPCKDPCNRYDDKEICTCDKPKVCTCDAKSPSLCKCFPVKICTCGDPDNCKCFYICDCTDPCLCDTKLAKPKFCSCQDLKIGLSDIVCTCPKQEDNKLRRVRAGKHGYRWCHEVDPKHTFFDYAYGRHELVEKKPSEPEKFVIQGLHDEIPVLDECLIHGVKAPKYEKRVKKPSLDCCSAVGGISISVQTLGEDKDKFLVQVVSYSSREGAKTGSKLVSILDSHLHTMEENRTEHMTKHDLTKEKRSYMAICANGYYNKVTRVCGDRDVVKRFYHTFEEAHDFLLEGANIVLMRYFGIRRYKGNIKTATVLIDGVICESVYVCHGVSQAIVNGTPLFVAKIERHIIEPSGYIHQTLTVLTLRGYIVSHEWADNCYVLHLNPLLRVIPQKDEIEQHAPLRKRWREDLQLLSDYLDFKTARTCDGGRYVTESGALTGAVRDYLQAILLLRPQDTVNFTRHYFKTVLSALDLPYDEYFSHNSKHVRYYFFED